MSTGLRDAGVWIKAHSESIFKTTYWSVTPGLGSFRYTKNDAGFYVHYIGTPGNSVLIPDKIPYLPGDTITIVGGSLSGTKIPITSNSNGTFTLTLSNAIIASDKYVWTFKLAYTSDW